MATHKKSKNDFYWADDKEPHFQRRQDILKAHPEVSELFGINPNMRYWTIIWVTVQMTVATMSYQLGWIPFLLVTYFVGGTIIHAMFLAVHEITHDLAFVKKSHNNILSFFANIPMVAPYAMAFKYYHGIHHWDQGKDGEDTDIPTLGEAMLFKGLIGKIIWFVSQIFFYALRPIMVKSLKVNKWVVYNFIFQITVMSIYFYCVTTFISGEAALSALFYLFLSLVFAGGLHPTSGHFISEHYVFEEGQETYSYYGPLNLLTFNVGYHNEHHDFPRIPGCRLPQLKKMAPEFYDHLHSYNSWLAVNWRFLTDKKVTLYSRTKRENPKLKKKKVLEVAAQE
jgi:sphingolipid 4-desaturase/C4-monooxygenase